jgi:hypothetical protein
MTVEIKPLSRHAHRGLHDLASSVYLDGECYAFAVALHRALDWPMVGLIGDFGERTVVRHALVETPCGNLMDVRGALRPHEDELGRPFDYTQPYMVRTTSEEELRDIRPIGERSIANAEWTAQCLWPELPWKKGPLVRYRTFLEELDALWQKHGICFHVPSEGSWPVLTERRGYEDIVMSPSANGPSWFFNRRH